MALPTSQHNVTVRKLSSTLNSYNTKVNTKLGGKADKVSGATNGNFAALDANGNLTDSGKKASNFATSAQGTKADSAIQSVKVEGTALTPDSNKAVNITKTSLGLNNVTNDAQVKRSEMGVANGVATLGNDGKVPSAQLPSFVDDVIEGYYYNSKFYRDSEHSEEITPASGIIYVDLPTNKTYRWSGSAYVEISASLALGETSSTAYRGDRGKTAYDHSQLTSGNPHNVTKSDVGLGSVVNTGDSATPVSGGTTKFTTGGAYTELAKKADKSSTVTNVAWDSTNKKLTKTINGTTTDIVTASTMKTAMALNNVNNTSDADKPISTATQAALDGKSDSNHTHTTALETDSGTPDVTLAHNTTYKLTAGDTSITFKTPADNNTDTKVKATAKTDNVNYKILATASASPTSGNATEAVYDTDVTLNPSTNTIAANISGNAATASKINTSAKIGDTNKPVYIAADGTPTQISVPSNAVFTDTDTKVTAVGNHYAPAEDSQAEQDASGGTATQLPTSSTGTLVQVVTGIKMDAKGHVTGVVSKGLWSPDNNTTYTNVKLGSGTASATLGTSPAFTASLSNYTLSGGNGGFIAIRFSKNVPASATLNVNSTGANAIYYKGAAITAGVIQSGDTAFMMYNGTQYVLLGTDRSVEEMTDTEVSDLVDALT